MSYQNNDYVFSNTVNENYHNEAKHKKSYQLKHLLRPLLALVLNTNKKSNNTNKSKSSSYQKKSAHTKNTYKKHKQPEYFQDQEEEEEADNLANEMLEAQILDEIDVRCEEDYTCGVPVYRNGHMDIMPVFRGQNYIPVHFAKTEAGTFFWTTMMGADCDINTYGDKNAISNGQRPQLQADRWAQA